MPVSLPTNLPVPPSDKAPVSKGLMGGLFLTCTAINVPLLSHLRHQLECRLPDMLGSPLVYRLLTSRLAFLDAKDLVCSAVLIYYFRCGTAWPGWGLCCCLSKVRA